jgi:glycosyltransferase involved in cell wall biosynthesis
VTGAPAAAAGLWPAAPATGGTLGIVMPAHGEAATLAAAIERIEAVRPWRVLVVDGGSTDRTPELVARLPDVELVREEAPRGYGAAVMAGFAVALERGLDPVVTLDADLQHEPERVGALVDLLADADLVTGSRWHARSPVSGRVPGQRSDMNRRVVARVNDLTGMTLTDALCGMRAYRAAAVAALVPALDEPGYGWSFQVFLAAAGLGLRVAETPVPAIYFDDRRPIPDGLHDPAVRWAYYERVFARSAAAPARR